MLVTEPHVLACWGRVRGGRGRSRGVARGGGGGRGSGVGVMTYRFMSTFFCSVFAVLS